MGERTLRLAFFGTPEFAVPTLEHLLAGPHLVVGVVSQPDRRRGRGRRLSPSPVSEVALTAGLPLLRPEQVADAESELRALEPDLGVVVAFGQFIPKRIRELPKLGYCINGHASMLPRWRGAAPMQHAILTGDATTGVSVMRVAREMDAGAWLLQRTLEIGADETAGELAVRMAALTADAIAEGVAAIAAGAAADAWTEQDPAGVTLAPKITRDDARIDWSGSAAALARHVRAMAPSPGASTRLDDEPLRILGATVEAGEADRAPGTVRNDRASPLAVATGAGWLVPSRLQRAGGKPLPVAEFLRGRALPDGTRLG
ncbi:MAG: methionyl-tRNA formyltransferase [Myxococcota bacterium]